jgi:predicted nuclease of restriction endonuclease-like (RecB) superfamily
MTKPIRATLYRRIREILVSARAGAARSVNTAQVCANWLIGREIVEEEQKGEKRAGYGEELLKDLSVRLSKNVGKGWSVRNLEYCRVFYLEYPHLLDGKKSNAVRSISPPITSSADDRHISNTVRTESWHPGWLHPTLSWTHYRTLLRVDKADARGFYEIEAIKNNWSARELERQINSLLYERLALSKDKKGLMELATRGHDVRQPADVFKDPIVMEFLGLPESPRLIETDLEQALINNLQAFLLELGKGFAFVGRQQRLTLDGDHFYIDLVFYHTVLKCYVIIDLKTGKLTHQDLGQLQLYVNYYDRERRTEGDNPTLGLILCTDKNDTVVKYTLGPDQEKKIFASRYKLHLPSEAELRAELQREIKALRATPKAGGET